MTTLIKNQTQCEKVLAILDSGEWVNGRDFLHKHFLSQYHARIKELEMKGYKIEHSTFKDEFGFVSYRLVRDNLFSK